MKIPSSAECAGGYLGDSPAHAERFWVRTQPVIITAAFSALISADDRMQNLLRVRPVVWVLAKETILILFQASLSLSPIHPVFQNKLISQYSTFDEVREKKNGKTFEDLPKPLRHTKKAGEEKEQELVAKEPFHQIPPASVKCLH